MRPVYENNLIRVLRHVTEHVLYLRVAVEELESRDCIQHPGDKHRARCALSRGGRRKRHKRRARAHGLGFRGSLNVSRDCRSWCGGGRTHQRPAVTCADFLRQRVQALLRHSADIALAADLRTSTASLSSAPRGERTIRVKTKRDNVLLPKAVLK